MTLADASAKPQPAEGSLEQFPPQQLRVARALRRGVPNKLIAYQLNMCESTVKVHVRNIMKKMKAKNRTEVAFLTNRFFSAEDDGCAGAHDRETVSEGSGKTGTALTTVHPRFSVGFTRPASGP